MGANARYMRRLMAQARRLGADVVHFPEGALSGYAPRHHAPQAAPDPEALDRHTRALCRHAADLGIWTVFGSERHEHGARYNCVHVVSAAGSIVASYDKRRLYRTDRDHFAAGNRPCTFDLRGHRCGVLICYDNCFPELFEEYRAAGVKLLFLSVYNAANARLTPIKDLMAANLIVRAADHGAWISASNSCERYSPLVASIVRPDGATVQARRHVTGLVTDDFPAMDLGWTYDNRAVEPESAPGRG